MKIIDAHQHLWDTSELRYPWLEGFDALNQRYGPEDYRAAFEGIDIAQSVHIEADPAPGAEVAEVDRLVGIAAEDGMIGAIVATAPLESADCEATLDKLAADYPMVVGIRRMAWHHEDPGFYRWPSLIEGVRLLPRFGYTFELCANVTQLDAAVHLVRATPDVTHAINHCGGPDIAGDGFEPWADYMNQLAAFPNTVCKISGLVTRANEGWTPGDLRPYIDHLIGIFGFDRVMYGSDWPVCTLAATYTQWFDVLAHAVEGASEDERRKLFHDNARSFYRLG